MGIVLTAGAAAVVVVMFTGAARRGCLGYSLPCSTACSADAVWLDARSQGARRASSLLTRQRVLSLLQLMCQLVNSQLMCLPCAMHCSDWLSGGDNYLRTRKVDLQVGQFDAQHATTCLLPSSTCQPCIQSAQMLIVDSVAAACIPCMCYCIPSQHPSSLFIHPMAVRPTW